MAKLLQQQNTPSIANSGNVSWSKLMWSADGKQMFVGDAKGLVHHFEVQDYVTARAPGDELKLELAILSRLSGSTKSLGQGVQPPSAASSMASLNDL